MPFLTVFFFGWEGSPTKNGRPEKSWYRLVLTSQPEELVYQQRSLDIICLISTFASCTMYMCIPLYLDCAEGGIEPLSISHLRRVLAGNQLFLLSV